MSNNLKHKRIIIIGAGISGAVLANILANKGWKVTVFERQNHLCGNCYDSLDKHGVLIHNYGPHIFHTSDEKVYKFISKFTKLNGYTNKVLVNVDKKIFPLPINFKSIEIIMGNKAPKLIKILKKNFKQKTITLFDLKQIKDPLVKEFVSYISKNVYFNYSAKMWGTKFENIDPATINRVKIILGYEHNYFPEDKYQGLPKNSYTDTIVSMLDHKNINIFIEIDPLEKLIKFGNKIKFNNQVIDYPIVYCGSLDEALNYKFGMLPYRSLDIRFQTLKKNQFQKAAVVNYPADKKMTRITEYKLMTFQNKKNITTISKEYPGQFKPKSKCFGVRYYPIINKKNLALYKKYLSYFSKYNNFYPLGRLAQYKYFDMDDAIKQAMELAKVIANE